MGSRYIPDLQHVCVYVAQDCAGVCHLFTHGLITYWTCILSPSFDNFQSYFPVISRFLSISVIHYVTYIFVYFPSPFRT